LERRECNKDSDVDSINNLILKFTNRDTSYVLIAARDTIYNVIKDSEFKNFNSVIRFEIDKPSYNTDKRKQVLEMYVKHEG
jgi:hypothetical protein